MAHQNVEVDIEELELALQGTLASSTKGKLLEVCRKVNIAYTDLVNKSRLSLVKLILLHVEAEVEKQDHREQRTFLVDVQQEFVERGPPIDNDQGDADSLDGSTPEDIHVEAALRSNQGEGERAIVQGPADD